MVDAVRPDVAHILPCREIGLEDAPDSRSYRAGATAAAIAVAALDLRRSEAHTVMRYYLMPIPGAKGGNFAGGARETHDWTNQPRERGVVAHPVILAGGLTGGERRRGDRDGVVPWALISFTIPTLLEVAPRSEASARIPRVVISRLRHLTRSGSR